LAAVILGFNVIPFTASALLAGLEDQKVSSSCRISPEDLKIFGGKTPNAGTLECGGGPGQCLLDQ